MTTTPNIDEHLKVIKENPFTGTTIQVVTVSMSISKVKELLDPSVFNLYKERSGIEAKTFSKLKKIGDKLNTIDEKKLKDVIKGLTPSYSSIHHLCSLKPEEVVTAVKSKCVTPSTSYRQVMDYVKQVKYPHLAAIDGEKGRWSTKQEHIWSIFREDNVKLEGQALADVETALRRVCKDYGLSLRDVRHQSKATIRAEERRVRASFWRKILEEEITQKWFQEQSDELKKQFNIKTVDELRDTPLRQFTGFLMKSVGNRDDFWKIHGQAYISKVQFLFDTTEDNAQRYNYKRRLETKMAESRDLAVFNNLLLKRGGFT